MDTSPTFDFDFGGADRGALIAEAQRTVSALESELNPDAKQEPSVEAATQLLEQLTQSIAEFGTYPEINELKEAHFAECGMATPVRFQQLAKQYRFYWTRIPITLAPLQNMPFNKLECAIEFNPGTTDPHLRPRSQIILPERKFLDLLEFRESIDLRIGEDFQFEVATPTIDLNVSGGIVKAGASVDAKAATKLGLMVGPFTYTIKKALLEHSPTDTEKVFWRLSGVDFLHCDEPTLIVVMKVPHTVKHVKIAAALQAYHRFNLGAAGLTETIQYFSQRLATFFRQGAPIRDTAVWDVTPSL